jgi:hypothetical protein
MKEALQLVDAEKDERINIKSLLPLEKMRQNAADWGQQYVNNEPFPHIGIDDFFDERVIRDIVAQYPGEYDAVWNRTLLDAGSYEEQKLSLDSHEDSPGGHSAFYQRFEFPGICDFS